MLTMLNRLLTANILASLVFLDFESLEPVVVRLKLLQKHLMLVFHQSQAHTRPSMNNYFCRIWGFLATIRLHFEEKKKINYNTKLFISHASSITTKGLLEAILLRHVFTKKYIVAKSKYLVLNASMVSCKATYLFCFLLCPKAIVILQAN